MRATTSSKTLCTRLPSLLWVVGIALPLLSTIANNNNHLCHGFGVLLQDGFHSVLATNTNNNRRITSFQRLCSNEGQRRLCRRGTGGVVTLLWLMPCTHSMFEKSHATTTAITVQLREEEDDAKEKKRSRDELDSRIITMTNQDNDGVLEEASSQSTNTELRTPDSSLDRVGRSFSHNDNDDYGDWLDRPFFVPEDHIDSDNNKASSSQPFLQWFAKLVQEDYNTAEALFASSFITLMVILTKEVLRMQLYGEQYIPFTTHGVAGGGGNLF